MRCSQKYITIKTDTYKINPIPIIGKGYNILTLMEYKVSRPLNSEKYKGR